MFDIYIPRENFYKTIETGLINGLTTSTTTASYDVRKLVAPFVKRYIMGSHFEISSHAYPVTANAREVELFIDIIVTENDPNKYNGCFTALDNYRVPHIISIIPRIDNPTDEDIETIEFAVYRTINSIKMLTDKSFISRGYVNHITEATNPVNQADSIAAHILSIEVMCKAFSYDVEKRHVQAFLDDMYQPIIELEEGKRYILGNKTLSGRIITADSVYDDMRDSFTSKPNVYEAMKQMSTEINFRYVFKYTCAFNPSDNINPIGIVLVDDDFTTKYLTGDNENIEILDDPTPFQVVTPI